MSASGINRELGKRQTISVSLSQVRGIFRRACNVERSANTRSLFNNHTFRYLRRRGLAQPSFAGAPSCEIDRTSNSRSIRVGVIYAIASVFQKVDGTLWHDDEAGSVRRCGSLRRRMGYLCLSTTCRFDLRATPKGSSRPFLPVGNLKFT